MGKIINIKTGEFESDKFCKMFFDDIGKLFKLSSAQKDLLFIMLRDCKYGNEINMLPKRKKLYVSELNLTSQNSLNGILKKIELSGCIKKDEEYPTKYIINPDIFFKGNDYQRTRVLISYSNGERKVKVLTPKDSIVVM